MLIIRRRLSNRDWLRLRHCLSRQWETYRAKRINCAHLAVLDDRPSVATDAVQLGRCRHPRQLCVRAGPPFRYDDTGASLSASIATLWNGAACTNRTVEPFGPVFKVTARSIPEPRNRARLDDAPALKSLGPSPWRPAIRSLTCHAAKGWNVNVRWTGGHGRI
jgi:hypothetical protein